MEQKENTGVLFKNDFKKTEKQPDYKGSCFIKGEKMEISAWLNESKVVKNIWAYNFQSLIKQRLKLDMVTSQRTMRIFRSNTDC